MLRVRVENDRVFIGDRLSVTFRRTLRVPDDGRVYPLPPGLGLFPVHEVGAYAERVPAGWKERGGLFVPVHQREALWLGFGGARWKPNALKVGVGKVNAVSGEPWDERLHDDPQDYVVCPQQPWLDGINAGAGFVRQFVAMPLGQGFSVEAQVTGAEEFGGIQLLAFEPKPGRFPERPEPEESARRRGPAFAADMDAGGDMGVGAGGKMRQKIYPDPFGLDAWDSANRGAVFVHLVNGEQYRAITGLEPPPTPVDAGTYVKYGLPWFDLYDEESPDLPAPPALAIARSVSRLEAARAGGPPEEESTEIEEGSVRKLTPPGAGERR